MRSIGRRIFAISLVVPLAGLSLIGGAAAAAPDKVTYCHATHSEMNPFVAVTTSKVAVLRAHQNHQDDEDVIPAFDYIMHDQAGYFPGQALDDYSASFVLNGCTESGPQ